MTSHVEGQVNIGILPTKKDVRTTMEVLLRRQILRGGKRTHRSDKITGELAGEAGVKEEGNFL